jgi:hypothetical protein
MRKAEQPGLRRRDKTEAAAHLPLAQGAQNGRCGSQPRITEAMPARFSTTPAAALF